MMLTINKVKMNFAVSAQIYKLRWHLHGINQIELFSLEKQKPAKFGLPEFFLTYDEQTC